MLYDITARPLSQQRYILMLVHMPFWWKCDRGVKHVHDIAISVNFIFLFGAVYVWTRYFYWLTFAYVDARHEYALFLHGRVLATLERLLWLASRPLSHCGIHGHQDTHCWGRTAENIVWGSDGVCLWYFYNLITLRNDPWISSLVLILKAKSRIIEIVGSDSLFKGEITPLLRISNTHCWNRRHGMRICWCVLVVSLQNFHTVCVT